MKKRNRNKKRSVLSVILSLTLAMSLMTASAFAAEENPEAAGADQAADVTVETIEETYTFDEAGTEDPAADTDQAADSTVESVEETYITDEAGTEDTDTDHTASDVSEELTGTPEGIDVDMEEAGDDSLDEEEYGPEALSAEGTEDEEAGEDEEEEDPEIQVFAATEEEQTLKVVQKEEGTIGDDVSFTYHLYQITEAAETIENMGDIISYEPGASLEYVIVETDTGEEVSDGTTDSEGTFTLHVGETAEFTLEAETSWFVNQDTPDAYPLVSVGSDGEYADVVDGTNGVVYYGQIEPEPVQPVISDVSVTSSLENNEKTYDGGSVILTAEATVTPDTAAVSYQWYKDGVEISGATDSTYKLTGNVSESGTYNCVVTAENDGLTAAAEAEVTVTINKAAQDISYAVKEMEKTLGEDPFTNVLTQTTVSKDDGAGITYASSDESVATVNADTGEVTIVGVGEATITATAADTDNYNGTSAGYTVTVTDAGLSVNVSSDLEGNTKVYDEKGVTLTAEAKSDVDGAEYAYQWYDAEDNALEGETGSTLTLPGNVSDSGKYTCIVTVTYPNGATGTAAGDIEITIEKAQQSISYTETSVEKIDYDDPFTNELTQTLVYGDITYSFTTQMGDEPVIELDEETGEVSIKAPGVVVVTATASGSDDYTEATATYILTVNSDLIGTEIDVNGDETDYDNDKGEYVDDLVYDGQDLELEIVLDLTSDELAHLTLNAIAYQWYSYDFELKTFSLINGATEDTYTLTGEDVNAGDYVYLCVAVVTYDNGYEHTVYSAIDVIIEKAYQSIVFEEESLEAVAGDTVTNEIMKEDSVIYGDVTYTSSDESIATVDEETGDVTIVGVGEVSITATAAETENYNAVSAEYTIATSDEVSVTVTSDMDDEDNTKTYDGKEVTLTAEASSKVDGVTYTYQWYTVDESGTETEIEDATEDALTLDGNAADSGTYKCTVTVTYPNDAEPATVSDTIEITINKAKQDISYEEDEIEKTTADEAFTNPLTETFISPEEGAGITYSSSDETVATVDENGKVTILAVGEATITATAEETANYAEATASYMITISKGPVVNYAVKLWGICTDTYSYDEGSTLQTASLTFGPATGANHLNSYVECSSDTCIHKLSWDEIIAYCNQYQGDSAMLTSLFGSCLENGCTKAVELTPNDTLFNMTTVNNAMEQGYTGDGVNTLFYLLNYDSSPAYACRWNYSYTGYSDSDPANIYSRSRIRATLTGDSIDAKEWVANDYNDYYGVDTLCNESDCLLSCFPAELQAAVVPRTTLNTGNATSGTSADDKTTYDKLFLFSLKETGITYAYDDGGGSDYGVNPNASDRVAYEFSGTSATTSSSHYWWSRSRSSNFNSTACGVGASGSSYGYSVILNYGLSPGFCIK